MEDRSLIYHLLYFGLTDIRSIEDSRITTKIADLLHNVPLKLNRAADGGMSVHEILNELREDAKHSGCEKWLESQILRYQQRQSNEQQKLAALGPGI